MLAFQVACGLLSCATASTFFNLNLKKAAAGVPKPSRLSTWMVVSPILIFCRTARQRNREPISMHSHGLVKTVNVRKSTISLGLPCANGVDSIIRTSEAECILQTRGNPSPVLSLHSRSVRSKRSCRRSCAKTKRKVICICGQLDFQEILTSFCLADDCSTPKSKGAENATQLLRTPKYSRTKLPSTKMVPITPRESVGSFSWHTCNSSLTYLAKAIQRTTGASGCGM